MLSRNKEIGLASHGYDIIMAIESFTMAEGGGTKELGEGDHGLDFMAVYVWSHSILM